MTYQPPMSKNVQKPTAQASAPMSNAPKTEDWQYFPNQKPAKLYGLHPNYLTPQEIEVAQNVPMSRAYPDPYQDQRGYWESPQRINRYYNLLRAAPPNWQAPEWMPVDLIKASYTYMRNRNAGIPWYNWQPLDPNDPVSPYLRSAATPPREVLWPDEQPFADREEQARALAQAQEPSPFATPGSWEQLPWYGQAMLGIFDPQTRLAGRPEWTRMTAALGQGGMAALGGAAAGAAIGGLIGNVPGAMIGALALGLPTAYQAYTGNEIPGVSDLLNVFNVPAQWLEQGVGTLEQALQSDQDAQDVFNNLPAAWQASQSTYESGQGPAAVGRNLINLLASLSGDQEAPAGYKWAFEKGIAVPVKIEGATGVNALAEARRRIENGKDPVVLYAEMVDRMGFSGTMNDFLLQTVLDPLNLAPFAEGRVGEGVSRALGNERLASAFKAGTGNPIIDLLPFGIQNLAEALTGQHSSTGLLGALGTYKGMIQTGYFPKSMESIPAKDLSPFEKWFGGLDENGEVKMFKPQEGTGLKGFFENLRSLTPKAKAFAFLNILSDNMDGLFSLSEGDPVAMNNLLERAANVDIGQVGEVGKDILNSPEMATVAGAVKDFVKTGKPKELLAGYMNTTENRNQLLKLAQMMEMEPGKFLEDLLDNPQRMLEQLKAKAATAGESGKALTAAIDAGKFTAVTLKKIFEPFTGDNAVPWHPDAYRTILKNAMLDHTAEFLVQRYGIKPEPWFFRVTQILKTGQSLALLGANPTYFLNNTINNMVTRSAQGVFGFMTPRQVEEVWRRTGIDPARLNMGIGMAGEGAFEGATSTTKGIKRKGNAIAEASKGDDTIAAVQKIVDEVNKKVGVFSTLSSAVEKNESRQAMTIGFLRAWNRLWKPGEGFHRMNPQLETMLDRTHPGMKEAIYSAVQAGMNMKEIEDALFGDVITRGVDSVLDEASKKIFPEHPEVARQILDITGLKEEIARVLKNAKSQREVDEAFDHLDNQVQDYVDILSGRELSTRARDVATRVKTEGFPAALEVFGAMQEKYGQRWLQHFREWEDVMERAADLDDIGRNSLVRQQMTRDQAEWKRLNDFELTTYAGIIKGLGIDTPASRQFIQLLSDIHASWKGFYEGSTDPKTGKHIDGRNDLYRKFFGRKFKNAAERNVAWDTLQVELEELYQRHVRAEKTTQMRMDDLFAQAFQEHTGLPSQNAKAWRQNVMNIRDQMTMAMQAFREQMRTGNYSAEQRRQMWAEFLDKTYMPLIAQLKSGEITGAYTMAGQQPPLTNFDTSLPKRPEPQGPETPPEQPVEPGPQAGPGAPPAGTTIGQMDIGAVTEWSKQQGYNHPEHLKNVVNKYSGKQYSSVSDIPWEEAQSATEAWKTEHATPTTEAEAVVQAHANAESITAEADRVAAEAEAHSYAQLTRRNVEEKIRAAFPDIPEEQVRAAMWQLDQRADQWARIRRQEPSQATRDEWYGKYVADVVKGTASVDDDSLYQFKRSWSTANDHPWTTLALKHFGRTNDIREAGYILPDGLMLDLSGRHEASGYQKREGHRLKRYVPEPGSPDYLRGQRSTDHRDLPDEIRAPEEMRENPSADMLAFMKETGAVRIDVSAGLISLNGPITTEQARIIVENFAYRPGWIEVDDPATGKQIWSQDFDELSQRKLRGLLVKADGIAKGEINPNDFIGDLNQLFQTGEKEGQARTQPERAGTPKGSVTFLDDGRAIITAFQGGDISTLVHESGHIFRRQLSGEDLDAVARWAGLKDGEEFTRLQQEFQDGTISEADRKRYVDAEEQFARGYERYLAEPGESIPPKMRSIFQRFSDWLREIYGKVIKGTSIDVELTPEIRDVMDRLLFEDEASAARKEKTSLLQALPKGSETTAFGNNPNQTYSFRFRIVDLDHLIMSQTETYAPTPEYPQELQPRMRDRAAAREQVNRIARELNPDALLIDTHQIDRGPMIVGPDLVVESGNGRSMALREAANAYPEKYRAYVQTLTENLEQYGFTEADLEGINRPVLVRERTTDIDRMEFTNEANQVSVLRMSEFEQALQDVNLINDRMLANLEVSEAQTIEQALQSPANIGIVRAFIQSLPTNERAAVVDASGQLSQAGYRRLRDAMFAKVYSGEHGQRLLRIFNESADPVISNVKNALFGSLAQIAKAEAATQAGLRDPELSITPDIAKAVDVYARLKQNHMNVSDYLGQASMFERELNPFQEQLLSWIAENGRSAKTLREVIKNYSQSILDQPPPQQASLFGDEVRPTKGEIFDGSIKQFRPSDEGTLFAAAEAETGRAEQPAPAAGARGDEQPEQSLPAVPPADEAPTVAPGRDELAGAAETRQPEVISFDHYAARNGAPRFAADVATQRLPGASEGQKARIVEGQLKIIQENAARREQLRAEYNDKVANGEIRPPTLLEERIRTAQGNPDNPSVQAARRLLNKAGISWESKNEPKTEDVLPYPHGEHTIVKDVTVGEKPTVDSIKSMSKEERSALIEPPAPPIRGEKGGYNQPIPTTDHYREGKAGGKHNDPPRTCERCGQELKKWWTDDRHTFGEDCYFTLKAAGELIDRGSTILVTRSAANSMIKQKPVAVLPAEWEPKPVETRDGQATLLGVDPNDPNELVYLKDGEIKGTGQAKSATLFQESQMRDRGSQSIISDMLLRDHLENLQPNADISTLRDGGYTEYSNGEKRFVPEFKKYSLHTTVPGVGKTSTNLNEVLDYARSMGYEISNSEKDGYGNPVYKLIHTETQKALDIQRSETNQKWANAKPVYLRFGKPPESGKSFNFRDRNYENGISVFNGQELPSGEVRPTSGNQFTLSEWNQFATENKKPLYVVEGNEVGTGSDGEPVLENVKIVREVKPIKEMKRTAMKQGQPLFQEAEPNAPWYYSQLQKVIEAKMPNKATAAQIRGMIAGQVKADELKWTGFDDWLNEQTGPVSKTDALKFIEENQIQINEVLRGDNFNKRAILAPGNDADGKEIFTWMTPSDKFLSDDFGTREEAISNAPEGYNYFDENYQPIKNLPAPIIGRNKYSEYTLPGGENYRELLLTLPSEAPSFNAWNQEIADRWGVAGTQEQYQNQYPKTYRSQHWNEPNVLAHVRFDDRTDVDGKKVLFIEEIQSDWHQQGREYGYAESGMWTLQKNTNLRAADGTPKTEYVLRDAENQFVDRFSDPEEARSYALSQGAKGVAESSGKPLVPDAPFSKNWEELVVKRIIRWAAENGYERVAWTTGKMQADRYNLTNQVDTLAYRKNPDGTYMVSAQTRNRGGVPLGERIKPEELPGIVGQDVARRITTGEGKKENWAGNNQPRNEFTVLRGQQLSVGGEGMHAFYDEKIPNIVRKYIKKWGGTVGETFFTEKGLRFDEGPGKGLTKDMVNGYTVPSFDVTPEMKRTAMKQGQPLFQEAEPAQQPTNPIGDQPLGTTPTPLYQGEMLDEVASERLRPLLHQMASDYKAGMDREFKLGDLDETARKQIRNWLAQVKNDQASTKLAALRFGENQRDAALLNYTQQYGMDQILNVVFPYQFWYTRSMLEWGKRMVDRPAWFAMYARLREKQEEMEQKGLPTRFAGKMRQPAPWLPDWMGGGLYFDPLQQLFPFAQFGQPLENMARNKNQYAKQAETNLREMVDAGKITVDEMNQALASQSGPAWERAWAQAQIDLKDQEGDPMNLVSMMMSPAMYISTPYYLSKGQPEKIGTLPLTRFASGLQTTLKDTPLQMVGDLAGIAAKPEQWARKQAKVSEFGEWGDYYIDRAISNMAGDGTISADMALLAMQEHQGPAYDMAMDRVRQEMALKVPGMSAIAALKGKATPAQFAAAVATTLFPNGILPEGELKLRGLKQPYNQAWEAYKNGDTDAIDRFFEEHPEYQARLALWDSPEERLRTFLVNQIWDRYGALEKPNRRLVIDQLGTTFQDAFLNSETADPSAIDVQTLAYWSQLLGGMVPDTDETRSVAEMPQYIRDQNQLQVYPSDLAQKIQAYQDEKNRSYPMINVIQDLYYQAPERSAARRQVLRDYPQLKEYWDWNRQYKAEHPDLQPYWDEQKARAEEPESLTVDMQSYLGMVEQSGSPMLSRQLLAYVFTGDALSEGATRQLQRIWEANGKPGGTFKEFLSTLKAAYLQ